MSHGITNNDQMFSVRGHALARVVSGSRRLHKLD